MSSQNDTHPSEFLHGDHGQRQPHALHGGYASLMSLSRHPEVYRCGVSFAGVTDIGRLYTARWGDLSDQGKRFTMPVLVGDPKADAEMLKAASPLAPVAEVQPPVLPAWGLLDRRVPPEHAERFVKAARAAGVKIEALSWGALMSQLHSTDRVKACRRGKAHAKRR